MSKHQQETNPCQSSVPMPAINPSLLTSADEELLDEAIEIAPQNPYEAMRRVVELLTTGQESLADLGNRSIILPAAKILTVLVTLQPLAEGIGIPVTTV